MDSTAEAQGSEPDGGRTEAARSVPSRIVTLWTSWLPWALFVLATAVATLDFILSLQNDQAVGHERSMAVWLIVVEMLLIPVTFTGVGAFIVTRRPGNRVGWLMIVVGIAFALPALASDYPGADGRTHLPMRPFGTMVAWVGNWDWTFYVLALLCLVLLFPTGSLPSRRWRPVLWLGITAWVAESVRTED